MSPSIFTRAAFAAGLLASTTSATFDLASKKNVAMYWGQGSNQIPLAQVCEDPNIDIVNLGFVNQFPLKRDDYPGTNFANACADTYYPDPFNPSKNSKLLNNCAGVEQAIKACQASGKKVMLSLGGGYPTNYTLPTPDVAAWFAEFLIGAYGPVTSKWGNKPRPFGSAIVDGFDLDLEADDWNVPSKDLLFKNYDVFGNYVKDHSNMLLSGAPQGIVPDSRISDALTKVPFDFIFVQFYNTWTVSAAKAVEDMKKGTPSTFTYTAWTNWIRANAKNPGCKVYLGLPAGPDGLPTHKDHYVKPEDANKLIKQYKNDNNFGGVMLWEATVNVKNPTNGQSFGTWMKYAVDGTFEDKFHPVVSSSTRISTSSTRMSTSSTRMSTSSTRIFTSSSVISTSSNPVSSSQMSSIVIPSSTPVSPTHISSSAVSSSISHVVVSSSVPVSLASSSAISSSAYATSSSVQVSESSSSIYVPSPSESSAVMVSSSVEGIITSSVEATLPAESSTISVSSSLEAIITGSVSASLPAESTVEVVSSIASVSSLSSDVSSSWITIPSPSSNSEYPAVTPSVAYPADTTKQVYPSSASSSEVSSSASSNAEVYSSMVYSTYFSIGSQSVSPSTAYPTASSSAIPSISKGIEYSAYPVESSKAHSEYAAASSTGEDYETAPSITKTPERSASSSVPAGSATTVVTTTYVDVCPTGLTTLTTTYTATVCTVCAKPTGTPEAEVPENWTTSVYVDSTVSLTITKPIASPTYVPAYPSSASVAYPADYPAAPMSSGKPAYSAVPEASKGVEYPAVPEASKPAGYPVVPEASKPAEYPAVPASSKAPEYPTVEASKGVEYPAAPASSKAPEYPATPNASKGVEYPAVPEASKPAEYPTAPEASKPTGYTAVPEASKAAEYPAYPAVPESSKGAEYPAVPKASKPTEYPTAPEVSKGAEYPAYPKASKGAEYPAVPEASKAAEYPTYPEASKAVEYPAVPEASKAAEYPAYPEASKAAETSAAPHYPSKPVVSEYPKKPVEQEFTSTIHVTLTKVAVPAYTPAPYPSAGAPYVPAGPAKNATSAMPTGTGVPTMPSASSPPMFEGSASRVGAGFMMLVGVVGAVLVL